MMLIQRVLLFFAACLILLFVESFFMWMIMDEISKQPIIWRG